MLTGDSLFVNDIARPDLAIDKEEGAHGVFESLHERILTLPSATVVWPGHLGGSLCGGPAMDMKPSSTLAYERSHNPMLQVEDESDFVEQAVGSLGSRPPNFEAIVELNKGELVTEGVEIMPLAPRQVEQKSTSGALLVDVRTDRQFDDAHTPGSVAIPATQAGFGTRLAGIADREQEILLVGRDDEDARRAATLALAVDIRRLGGFLHGGMTEWRREQRPVGRIERLELEDHRRPARGAQPRACRSGRVRVGSAGGGGIESRPALRRRARPACRQRRGSEVGEARPADRTAGNARGQGGGALGYGRLRQTGSPALLVALERCS